MENEQTNRSLSRREFVGLGVAGVAALAIAGIRPGQVLAADEASSTVIIKHTGDPMSWCPLYPRPTTTRTPCARTCSTA